MLEKDLVAELSKAYAFLGASVNVAIDGEHAVITAQVGKPHLAHEAQRAFERGTEAARHGHYERAIQLFKQTLDSVPDSVDARRNLALAYLESKQLARAKVHVLEALRLDPRDAWSNLLLGNILAKYEGKLDVAMKWYERAYAVNPQDAIVLTNLGAVMAEQGQRDKAFDYYAKAMTADPKYPNAYYASAFLNLQTDRPDAALTDLEALFANTEPMDTRSKPLMAEARKLYLEVNTKVAEQNYDELMQAVQTCQAELGTKTGYRIDVVEDSSLEVVSAVSQMAWKHNRDYHLIKYRRQHPVILPHLLFHEMQHIAMEDVARKAGRNRYFGTTTATRAHALRVIQEDLDRLRKMNLDAAAIDKTIQAWVSGLANQLFNIPLDMVIEHALFEQQPALRPAQFLSLHDQHLENLTAVTDPNIKRRVPSRIYKSNVAMNCAYALFMDFLYQGRTDYAAPYRDTNVFNLGERLFKIWKDSLGVFEPGDEYILVDEFARELRLQGWYEWVSDVEVALDNPDRPEGSTNPDLLRSKDSAAIWYLLAALERFEKLSPAEVREITSDIALLGVNGLDYASPEEKYTVRSLPDAHFSGLQLMCLMYAGFKLIDPALNTSLDLDAPYEAALKLHRAKKAKRE